MRSPPARSPESASRGTAHHEFLVFCTTSPRLPDQQLHLVMDNYAAHKHPKVKAWLATNPSIQIHFSPTSDRG